MFIHIYIYIYTCIHIPEIVLGAVNGLVRARDYSHGRLASTVGKFMVRESLYDIL